MFYLDIPHRLTLLLLNLAQASAFSVGQVWITCLYCLSVPAAGELCLTGKYTLLIVLSTSHLSKQRKKGRAENTCQFSQSYLSNHVWGLCLLRSEPFSHKTDDDVLFQMDLVREISISLRKNLETKTFVAVMLFLYFCL